MGKTKKPAINTDVLELKQETSTKEIAAHNLEIMNTFCDGLPFNREWVENKTRNHLQRSAEDMLRAGQGLLTLKEQLPHGEYLKSLERLEVNRRVATRMMGAALKFGKWDSESHSKLGITKMYELSTLGGDELEELQEGGTVRGLVLDDIDKMTTTELRKVLREKKQELITLNKNSQAEALANTRLLLGKDKKINEYEKKVDSLYKPEGWSTHARRLIEQLNEESNAIDKHYSNLKELLGQVNSMEEDLHSNAQYIAIGHAQRQIEVILDQARELMAHAQSLCPDYRPHFYVATTAEDLEGEKLEAMQKEQDKKQGAR